MGAGNSKPAEGESQYVFKANHPPTSFSHDFLQSLQNTAETDSTRARALELHIQARVQEELKKAHSAEIDRVNKLTERLVSDAEQDGQISAETRSELQQHQQQQQQQQQGQDASDDSGPSIFERVATVFESAEAAEARRRRALSREAVLSQIGDLKEKLDGRKRLGSVDPAVAKAKADVVTCLRLHDRRPLDCWEEVEKFKNEVARLEKTNIDELLG